MAEGRGEVEITPTLTNSLCSRGRLCVPKKSVPGLFQLESRKAWFSPFSELHVLIVHEIRRDPWMGLGGADEARDGFVSNLG